MPSGDDVTGLHAFDDLDPVSTVSALNVMPEPDLQSGFTGSAHARGGAPFPQVVLSTHAEYGAPSEPPPRPSSLPPPRASAGSAQPGSAAALPPPAPRGGMAVRSVPPPPPARREDGESVEAANVEFDEESDGGDTKVVAQSDYVSDEYAGPASDSGGLDAALDARELTPASTGPNPAGIDDNELLELSATTVATKIEMDWDEEEVETKLRDDTEAAVFAPPQTIASGGRPSPFPAPMTSSGHYPGNPSPFAGRSSFPPPVVVAPEVDAWGDDALTRVMRSSLPPPPALPEEWNRSGARDAVRDIETLAGHDLQEAGSNKRWTWIGFGAVGVIAMSIVAKVLFSSPETATVTLTTSPSDASVLIDGHLLGGQTSPFTVQGLSPSVAHSIEVHKDGYATAKQQFEVKAGEVKPLAGIELTPLHVDTGFALSSVPGGASVYVDDHKLPGVTPLRVADMSEGLHVVRLELANGYQPWETQVALAKGQVIELPTARLVPSSPGIAHRAPVVDAAPESSGSALLSSASHHHSSSVSSGPRAPSTVPGPSFMPRPSAPAPAPVASALGGKQGILRVNSRPWSQVFIDGRMIGNTPQLNVPLSPGRHKVKLVNPQLGMSKGFDVNIAAGKPTTKVVELME